MYSPWGGTVIEYAMYMTLCSRKLTWFNPLGIIITWPILTSCLSTDPLPVVAFWLGAQLDCTTLDMAVHWALWQYPTRASFWALVLPVVHGQSCAVYQFRITLTTEFAELAGVAGVGATSGMIAGVMDSGWTAGATWTSGWTDWEWWWWRSLWPHDKQHLPPWTAGVNSEHGNWHRCWEQGDI